MASTHPFLLQLDVLCKECCKIVDTLQHFILLPRRVSCNQRSAILAQHMKTLEQAQEDTSPAKINVTIKSPVGDISVVTLIRTDTTLDHSQKAEKVCNLCLEHHSVQIEKKNGHAVAKIIHMFSLFLPSAMDNFAAFMHSSRLAAPGNRWHVATLQQLQQQYLSVGPKPS